MRCWPRWPRRAQVAELEVIEHALALDLLLTADGRAAGITLHVLGEGQTDGVGAVHARAVVLASGGFGQIYSATTNPPVSTGDGVALALRAGAEVADLEFVQFHPTVLWLGPDSRGRQPLISEAVRGEGAVWSDASGRRFMAGQHPLADLAPRDVVAKAIMREMHRDRHRPRVPGRPRHWARRSGSTGSRPSWRAAGARHRPGDRADPGRAGRALRQRRRPHRPARPDQRARACTRAARVACTGVHGANRLASNSLLEGLVFAERIAAVLARGLPPAAASRAAGRPPAGVARPVDRPAAAAADVGSRRSAAVGNGAVRGGSRPVRARPSGVRQA